MQAVILAGGKGTRLAERLQGRPKPLVDVDGVPLLQRQIETLRPQGVTKFLILVNHAADQIEAFLAENGDFGCDIATVDDGEPRGTAGAVLGCLDALEEQFLVVYGDTLFSIDVGRMGDAHRRSGAQGTLFLHPNDHPHDSDLVELDGDDRILAFHPYPHPEGAWLANQVNAAFYILEKSALEPWRGAPGLLDFGKDLFPRMIERGVRLQGYRSFEYIKDLGTPKRLDKVERHLREGAVERASLSAKQRCVFVDRDGTLNVQKGYIRSPQQFELIEGVGAAVRRLNDAEFRIAVVTNQPVIARGDVGEAELRRIHARMETDLGAQGGFVDRIYHCPHHPDAGFPGERPELKIACDCRKPAPGLLLRAAAELNADLARSWMVGDSTADILAARRAGVRSILVATGEGGGDGKYSAVPDVVVRDFPSAVDFIVSGYPSLAYLQGAFAAEVGPGDLVLIGGLARSGKSTLASVVRHELDARGLRCQGLSLDAWIRPEAERRPGVGGRFDLAAATDALGPWLDGGDLRFSPPFYDRFSRRTHVGEPIGLAKDDVLLLEGVPALFAEFATSRRIHRVHVQADEDQRAQRVIDDLIARGSDPAAARTIYEQRMADEAPLVAQSARSASHTLSLDSILSNPDRAR